MAVIRGNTLPRVTATTLGDVIVLDGATTRGITTENLFSGRALLTSTYNGNFWTAGTGTLTLGAGKTLTASNTMTMTAVDGSSIAFGSGGTVAYISNNLSVFAATTSAQLAGIMSDETGTGLLVFSISPALTGTPTAPTAAVDTNTTQIATTAMVLAQASAVNPLVNNTVSIGISTRYARADHVHPVDTSRQATLTAGQLPGETSTGSATAGNVGEVIQSSVASGSAVSLSTGVAVNITSISLTAGDWDVSANIYYGPAASTNITVLIASISQTTGTLDLTTLGATNNQRQGGFVPGAGGTVNCLVGPLRISLSGATTIFLVTQANFTVSTLSGYGAIRARRAR
jgi:hypothetical protein